jgi:signal transduction histidine kinase
VLVAGLVAAAIVIIGAAIALVQNYHTEQHERAEQVLIASATNGALAMERWLADGYADVEIIATQSGIAERYSRWREGLDPFYPRLLSDRIDADRRIRRYDSVVMLATDGSVVAASPDASIVLDIEDVSGLVDRALLSERPLFEDHLHPGTTDWMVAWAAPVRQSPGAEPVAVMVYTTSMREPASTLLGNDLLAYESEQLSLAREHAPGFDRLSTANGFEPVTVEKASPLHASLVEGLETEDVALRYGLADGGVDAMAAAHRVAETGWLVSARVNAAEVDGPVWRFSIMVGLIALFLIATIVLGGTMLWRVRDQRYREHQVLLELADALEVRDRFLTSMSHELRTPLQSIMGFTSIMLGGLTGPLNDEQRRQLSMVDESSKRLLAMVDDVLDMSKMYAGHMHVTVSEFTAGEVERLVCGMMHPLIERKAIACAPIVEDDRLVLRTDRDMVERIVLNLVSNAIKFTDEGFVNMSIRPDGPEHVLFEVTDSGRGIPADQLERVMEEFHQVIEVGGVKPVGTGLGLAISRRMAEALGGTLSCESEVGKGSRFWLRIPRVYPGAAE